MHTMILVCLFIVANMLVSKYTIEMSYMVERNGWVFVDSMYLEKGSVEFGVDLEFQFSYRENKNYSLEIALVNEKMFSKENTKHCDNNISSSIKLILVQPIEFKQKSKQSVNIEWENNGRGYILVRDCKQTLINQYFKKSKLKITTTIKSNGENYSGFKVDSLLLILQFSIIIYIFYKNYPYRSSLDELKKAISFIYVLNFVTSLIKIAYIVCALLGFRVKNLIIFSNFYTYLAETTAILLLLQISFGWSVHKNGKKSFGFTIFNCFLLIFMVVICTYSFHLWSNGFEKNDLSLVICVIRLIIFTIFLAKNLRNISEYKKQHKFWIKLTLGASLWWLPQTIFLAYCNIVSYHDYEYVWTLADFSAIIFTIFSYDVMFRRGCLYNSVAYYNRSFIDD